MTTERNEQLDDLLNDTNETVTIWGLNFEPADIVFELDPIAYRCMVADMWFDEHNE